jgi:predicted permease
MDPGRFTRLLGRFIRSRRADEDLDAEIRAHLEIEIRQRIEAGQTPAIARTGALKAFGNIPLVKEVTREMWGWSSIEHLEQDLRYALRMLRKNPGFTVVAVLSLALGIGATTAVFSVLDAAVLRPLPVVEPDRLVILSPHLRGRRFVLFNPLFEELRRTQTTLQGVFAVSDQPYLKVTLDGDSNPTYVSGSYVSGGYFPLLGVSPALGRLLTENDDLLPGESGSGGCGAVISHGFWMRRYRQDPTVLGRTLRVRSTDCAIVGVAPRQFRGHQPGFAPDLWVPLRPLTDPNLLASQRMAFFSGVMGRLRGGVALAQAELELTMIYQRLVAAAPPGSVGPDRQPATAEDFTMRLLPGDRGLEAVRREFARPLTLVLAVVGVVLLIAAVNVANLSLARGAARASELATRAALGADRVRLIRQLATEGALLAAIGGFTGIGLAWIGTPALAALVSLPYLPISLDTRPDYRVLVIALFATGFSALLTGILPALRLSGASLQSAMAGVGRTTSSRPGLRLMRTLVAAQLALSFLLVSGAGLLLQTIVRIYGVDPGFQPEQVLVLDVRHERDGPSFGVIDSPEEKSRRAALYLALEERLNALPGVRSASLSWLGLFGGNYLGLSLIDPEQPDDRSFGLVDYVSPHYFDTVGMQLVRGRSFTSYDRDGTLRVALVNEALVRKRFGDGEALGRRLALDYPGEETRPFTVIGVARDSKYNDLRETRAEPMMWAPLAQAPFHITSVSLRIEPRTQAGVLREARKALAEADPELMVQRTTTLSARMAERTSRERLMLGLALGFGGLALVLAVVGLYGTLAYAVGRRTREIGLRLALGATRGEVLRQILAEAARLVVWAFVVGLPFTIAVGRALRAYLFGVAPHDPATLVLAGLMLAVAAMAAACVPARRAARIDPMTALRHE